MGADEPRDEQATRETDADGRPEAPEAEPDTSWAPGAGRDPGPRRADRGRRGGPPWGSGPPPWVRGFDEDADWDGWGPPWRRARRGEWRRDRPRWWAAADDGARGPRPRHWRRFGCLFALIALSLFLALVSVAVVGLFALASLVGFVAGGATPTLPALLTTAVLVLVGVGIVVLLGLARTLRTVARPLDDLAEAAARVEAGDYSARVDAPVRSPRVVRDLVRRFNTMAGRLEADEARRQALLADVSHELRTPLAVIHGTLEAMIDGIYPRDVEHLEPLLDETRVLSRLVEDLRTVALADAGTLALHREPTDLAVLAAEVAGAFGPQSREVGVAIDVYADDLPLVDVDPVRLREVLGNLVANALRHSKTGGRVTIRARAEPRAIVLEVVDTGTGIDPALLPHVFERFAKGAESRGSGLGLAIARGLVEAHRGTISAESTVGSGTTMRIRLPTEPTGG